MKVILLERVEKLGQMGDVVKVKDGFARNYLLPKKKALRANKANLECFEGQKRATRSPQPGAQEGSRGRRREARRQDLHPDPPGRRPRPALRLGFARATSPMPIAEGGFTVGAHAGAARQGDQDDRPVQDRRACCIRKSACNVTINVARSEDEAERQARGEDVLAETHRGRRGQGRGRGTVRRRRRPQAGSRRNGRSGVDRDNPRDNQERPVPSDRPFSLRLHPCAYIEWSRCSQACLATSMKSG